MLELYVILLYVQPGHIYIGITKLFMGWLHELIKLADLITVQIWHTTRMCVFGTLQITPCMLLMIVVGLDS
jgi:hypothetical protein